MLDETKVCRLLSLKMQLIQFNNLREVGDLVIFRSSCYFMRFQVLTAANVKFKVLWNVAPCSHIEVGRHLRSACCLHHQGDDKIIVDGR
jgi:hypothetical protein